MHKLNHTNTNIPVNTGTGKVRFFFADFYALFFVKPEFSEITDTAPYRSFATWELTK